MCLQAQTLNLVINEKNKTKQKLQYTGWLNPPPIEMEPQVNNKGSVAVEAMEQDLTLTID